MDDESITNAVQKSSWAQNATEVAQIQLRCKSQKEPGQVWFRVITGNAAYRYKSLALWVADRARLYLRRSGNDHLVLSGVDFVRRLKAIRFSSTALLVKLDVKDL